MTAGSLAFLIAVVVIAALRIRDVNRKRGEPGVISAADRVRSARAASEGGEREAGTPAVAAEAPITEPAGFWVRVLATLVDVLCLAIPMLVLLYVLPHEAVQETLYDSQGNVATINTSITGTWITNLAYGLLFILYKGFLESSSSQATFGKRVLRLRVTDLQGNRISFWRAVYRAWPFWLPFLVFSVVGQWGWAIAGVSCIAVGFTHTKEGFHDQMAHCLVVRAGNQSAGSE